MFKKITEDAILPTRGSKYAACVDVYANEDVVIEAGETQVVGLGIAISGDFLKKAVCIDDLVMKDAIDNHIDSFKKSHYLQLSLRSSLGKKGLIMPHGVGVVDLDYRDEIKIVIHNPLTTAYFGEGERLEVALYDKYKIKKGDKIGQITLLEHKSYLFGIGADEERVGGFGSTGER